MLILPFPGAESRAYPRCPERRSGWFASSRHGHARGLMGTGGSIAPMTDLSTDPQAAAPAFDAERRATELAILDALRAVVDPEIGMNVVELALIKQILLGPNETEIKMILTTP